MRNRLPLLSHFGWTSNLGQLLFRIESGTTMLLCCLLGAAFLSYHFIKKIGLRFLQWVQFEKANCNYYCRIIHGWGPTLNLHTVTITISWRCKQASLSLLQAVYYIHVMTCIHESSMLRYVLCGKTSGYVNMVGWMSLFGNKFLCYEKERIKNISHKKWSTDLYSNTR